MADGMRQGAASSRPGQGKTDIDQRKEELRRECKMRRAEAHDRLGASGGDAIAERFAASISLAPQSIVAGYASIRDEPDVLPLLTRLVTQGHCCALPAVVSRAAPLEFRRWRPGEALEAAEFGVPTPAPGADVMNPDVLLVPLVGFDRRGRRIGYGGGFYDRTLEALRGRRAVVTVGIAFSDQEVDEVPAGDHDQPLDWVITEREAMRFA